MYNECNANSTLLFLAKAVPFAVRFLSDSFEFMSETAVTATLPQQRGVQLTYQMSGTNC